MAAVFRIPFHELEARFVLRQGRSMNVDAKHVASHRSVRVCSRRAASSRGAFRFAAVVELSLTPDPTASCALVCAVNVVCEPGARQQGRGGAAGSNRLGAQTDVSYDGAAEHSNIGRMGLSPSCSAVLIVRKRRCAGESRALGTSTCFLFDFPCSLTIG
jgi:hypothetical protein